MRRGSSCGEGAALSAGTAAAARGPRRRGGGERRRRRRRVGRAQVRSCRPDPLRRRARPTPRRPSNHTVTNGGRVPSAAVRAYAIAPGPPSVRRPDSRAVTGQSRPSSFFSSLLFSSLLFSFRFGLFFFSFFSFRFVFFPLLLSPGVHCISYTLSRRTPRNRVPKTTVRPGDRCPTLVGR